MLPSREALIVIGLLLGTCSFAQQSILNKPVPAVPSGKYSLLSLLERAGLSTNVPIGIEVAGGGFPREKFYPGNPEPVTLKSFLGEIIKKDGPYIWNEEDGVINVFPKAEDPDVFASRVDSFTATDMLPIEMLQSLLRQPAVADYLAQRKVTAATWVTGSVSVSHFSISIQNVSFRAALNQIVIKTGRPGWIAFPMRQNAKDYLWFQLW